jgi:hypothetical protein
MAVILTKKNLEEARVVKARPDSAERAAAGAGVPVVAPSGQPDDALTRILKLVPGEAAVAYTSALAVGSEVGDKTAKYLPGVAFVLCALLVPLVIRRDALRHVPPVKPMAGQYVLQLLAFAAWAFSASNPLAAFDVTVPKWIPGLLVILVPAFGAMLWGESAPATPAGQTT